jgi:hypothetical protein
MTTRIAKVGDPATMHYPSDQYPYVVVAVSASGSKITLEALDYSGLAPAYHAGPFPVFDSEVPTDWRTGRMIVAHLAREGYNYAGSTPISIGYARYRRDHSD